MLNYNKLITEYSYDPDTGVFTKNGKQIGSKTSEYVWLSIFGKRYAAGKIAVLFMTGRLPSRQVDHINLDKRDNRWCNLREATQSQNQGNKPILSNNKSGFTGVHFSPQCNRWRAQIKIHGKKTTVGTFRSKEAAIAVYRIHARKHFGEFARLA